MRNVYSFVKPGECGTFTLSESEKRVLWEAAQAQKVERAARLPDEQSCIAALFDAYVRLKELGWREAPYAPKDYTPIEMIEAGSTGTHRGYRDDVGFWIVDGDVWPSRPVLWRLAPTAGEEAAGSTQPPERMADE